LSLPSPEYFETLTYAAIAAGIAIALGLAIHFVLFGILTRVTRYSESRGDDEVVRRLRNPIRWLVVAIAISVAAEAQPMLANAWEQVARFVVPGLLGWAAYSLVQALATAVDLRMEHYPDEYAARSRRTRVSILSRAATAIIIFVTVSLMLLGIPGVRSIGVTLMASAGLMGLAVGAAAQPALRSLIAGLQMAITEPIRLGDLIVIDGQTGRVEELRMSYAVIRLGDERRLIVPTSRFLDTTFQNCSRASNGLTGTVVLPVAWGSPIGAIREKFHAIVTVHPDWDHRTCELQVSEARVDSIELTMTVSAHRSPDLSRLRADVREGMVEWLRTGLPDAPAKP
jgi:small-conductance mechanosensitive channel